MELTPVSWDDWVFGVWLCAFIKPLNEDLRASILFMECSPLKAYVIEMLVYFLWVFTYREVMGLAEIAACLYKREPKYFSFPSFWLTLIFELCLRLPSYWSSSSLRVGICLINLDLPLHPFLHLFMIPYPNLSSECLCSHCNALSCFHFVLFFFCVFSFLNPVLPVPQLLTLNGSVDKLSESIACLEEALTQNFSCLSIATFY